MNVRHRLVSSVLLLLVLGCRSAPAPLEESMEAEKPQEEVEREVAAERVQAPKRIIVFIGDGMGLNYVAASSYFQGKRLEMLGMEEFRLITTHGYERITTDSAASATAFATGEKTQFEGVSVRPGTTKENEEEEENHFRTLVGAAKNAGWRTGLVSTVRLNHATPGPFAAHRHHRHSYEEIARDMSGYGVDLLLGPGLDFFSARTDERELLEEMSTQGYEIATNSSEVRSLSASATRLVGLLHDRDMPAVHREVREMSLAEMTEHSLKVLDRDNEEGFFLLVEGALIDWAGHAMDGEWAIKETLDMDEALQVALAYARDRDDTLVVVTADHETGAMAVLDDQALAPYVEVLGGHDRARQLTLPEDLERDRQAELRGPYARFGLPEERAFGPRDAPMEAELVTSFGFLSAASRFYWNGRGRFSAIHTPEMVPLFAQGIGARELMMAGDNSEVGRLLMSWIDGGFSPEEKRAGTLEEEEPLNVILLIGDGLGVASLSAGYYHFGSLEMLGMSRQAAVSTHALDRLVNDSAASATALASGYRTRRGLIGLVPDEEDPEILRPVESVLEAAAKGGRRTGIVTTTSLTDATPAAFYGAHNRRRENRYLAEELVGFHVRLSRGWGVDLLIGGGAEYFGPEQREELTAQGYGLHYEFDSEQEELPIVKWLASRHLPAAEIRQAEGLPTLGDLTEYALGRLSGDEGFFLLIEGGQIDFQKHQLDRGPGVMAELREFDDAVRAALEFAEVEGNTLVLVTADHDHTMSVLDNHYGFHREFCGAVSDCGGPVELIWLDVAREQITRGEGIGSEERISVQYSWVVEAARRIDPRLLGPHSANFVPLFASGPGERDFGGFLDQPEIGAKLLRWARGRDSVSSSGRGD